MKKTIFISVISFVIVLVIIGLVLSVLNTSIGGKVIYKKKYTFDSKNYNIYEDEFTVKKAGSYVLKVSDLVQETGNALILVNIYDKKEENYWATISKEIKKTKNKTITERINLLPNKEYIIETYFEPIDSRDENVRQKGRYKVTLQNVGPLKIDKEVEVNKKNKIKLKEAGQTVFKYTPEKDGVYEIVWYDPDEPEEDSGMYELYENIEKRIAWYDNPTLKAGNDYYFIHYTDYCDDKCYTFLKVEDINTGKITDEKTVTIEENTILDYESTTSEIKEIIVNGDKDTEIEVKDLSGDTIGYAENGDTNYFQADQGEKYRLVCKGINKKTKITIKKAPDNYIESEEDYE